MPKELVTAWPIGKAGGKAAPTGTEISTPDVAPAFVEFLIVTLKGQDSPGI